MFKDLSAEQKTFLGKCEPIKMNGHLKDLCKEHICAIYDLSEIPDEVNPFGANSIIAVLCDKNNNSLDKYLAWYSGSNESLDGIYSGLICMLWHEIDEIMN